MRFKMLKKGEVLIKSGEFVKDWIFVSKGKLMIERDTTFEKINYKPGTSKERAIQNADLIDLGKQKKSSSSWVQSK